MRHRMQRKHVAMEKMKVGQIGSIRFVTVVQMPQSMEDEGFIVHSIVGCNLREQKAPDRRISAMEGGPTLVRQNV